MHLFATAPTAECVKTHFAQGHTGKSQNHHLTTLVNGEFDVLKLVTAQRFEQRRP